MPTYDFRCPEGHEFSHFYRKMSDAAMELPCPECGAIAARRISGGAGLAFKGSGFYLTDYGKNAHRKAAPAAKDGKGESKPDAKPDSASKSEGGAAKSAEPKGTSGSGGGGSAGGDAA